MSGNKSRRKGKVGEREFRLLLESRDWTVVNTADGDRVEDCVAVDRANNKAWSVEIKNTKLTNWDKFRKQAREQAKKTRLPWLLAIKIPGTKNWIVERQGERVSVWHG